MEIVIPTKWLEYIDILDIAFQPIIDINSSKTYGVEALLRNFQDIGFSSIFEVFDQAYKEGVLHPFDIYLRKKLYQSFQKSQILRI